MARREYFRVTLTVGDKMPGRPMNDMVGEFYRYLAAGPGAADRAQLIYDFALQAFSAKVASGDIKLGGADAADAAQAPPRQDDRATTRTAGRRPITGAVT